MSYPYSQLNQPPPLPPKPNGSPRSQRDHHPRPHLYIPGQQNFTPPPPPPPPPPPLPPKGPAISSSSSSNERLHQTGWMQYVNAANAQLAPDGSYLDDYDYNGGYSGYGQGSMSMPTPNTSTTPGPDFARAYSSGGSDYNNNTTPTRRSPSFSAYAYTNGQNGHAPGSASGNSGQDRYYLYDRNYDNYDYDYEQEVYGKRRADNNGAYWRSDVSGMQKAPSTSSFNFEGGTMSFPEPEILHRSISEHAQAPNQPPQRREMHRHTNSDKGPEVQLARADTLHSTHTTLSRHSSHSSYAPSMDRAFSQESTDELTDELSAMTLESEEGLRRFQAGELPPADEEWHKLVPESAREALGEREVLRQSIFFEIFKSERDYVADLEAVIDVFIQPLREANLINGKETEEFIQYVFGNLNEILAFHQRMLGSLFARQREQHPLIQSVADIILETALQFQPAYDAYIKHYPLSEARHRTELKQNPSYRDFLQKANQDPRIKKRDLVTFLSRPVTRLPRLSLLLETLLKRTDGEHPDQETVKLITGILSDFVKSTQPGIEAAESKVKYFGIMENLVYRKGEIIDLDDQDESRSLVHSQTLARRQRTEIDWSGWNDYFVILLDHYLLITREWKRPNSGSRYEVASRPIPLEFLRLGRFDEPPESRREKADEGGGILDNLRFQTRPQYPFTVYHAADKLNRRYTFFTNTESARKKWQELLKEAMTIHSVRREANRWFAPNTINDGIFRVRTTTAPSNSASEQFTGDITAADTFYSQGRTYVVVGCTGGVYSGARGETTLRRVLPLQSTRYIVALPDHNKVLIHADNSFLSYSMDLLVRVSQGSSPSAALEASMEKVSGSDTVTIARAGVVKDRTVVIYVAKSLLQTTVHAYEALKKPLVLRGKSTSFKSFGEPFYVPRAATEITPLAKSIAIATDKGITVIDPTNLRSTSTTIVPDFTDLSDPLFSALKSRCDSAKPLGLARVDRDSTLVVYEEFGCYVSRYGQPIRKAAVVRWEVKAVRFADRGAHVLLFSSCAGFVEVREKGTGRLVQVVEGEDMRLLNTGLVPFGAGMEMGRVNGDRNGEGGSDDAGHGGGDAIPLLASRAGKKKDRNGRSVEFFELVKTAEIDYGAPGMGYPEIPPDHDQQQEYGQDDRWEEPNPDFSANPYVVG